MSITDLADRTGVPPATLRSWEARYGLPAPRRSAGGHRRYDEEQVGRVEQLLALRDSGLGLAAAAAQVDAGDVPHGTSLFAGLVSRHSQLRPQVLRRRTLQALTWALEDECSARAERPALFAAFQNTRQYDQSRPRWDELSRVARSTVIFADFPDQPAAEDSPLRVPVPADVPLRREWAVVCDSPTYPACLSGWEQPREPGAPRIFETIWSVEPRVVRDAAMLCASMARTFSPQLGPRLADQDQTTPPGTSADLRRASGLLDRMVGYLDATVPRPAG